MIDLQRLQQDLQAYLMGDDDNSIHQHVTNRNDNAHQRLLIYANAYRLRLQDSLLADFSTLHTVLGDDLFSELAYEYIRAYPSEQPSIRWFGQDLQCFLHDNLPYKEYPYLSELAALEWALVETFDAGNAETVSADLLKQVSSQHWGDLCIQFHPSVHRLDLHWNVVEMRKQAQKQDELSPPEFNQDAVPWLIWRQELTTHYISLTKDAAWAIDAINHGATFAEVCAGLCEWMNEEAAGPYAANLLHTWLSHGLITKISIKGNFCN